MNDNDTHALIIALAIFFLLMFGGLTIVALSTATLNYATIMAGGISIFICVVILIGLIGAIRNPPDE